MYGEVARSDGGDKPFLFSFLISLDFFMRRCYDSGVKENVMQAEATRRTLTEGPIRRNLFLFALPIFLSNLFQQLYNSADSIIVGRFLGGDALAAVSSSGNLIFLMVGFFNGTAVGAGVVIARYFGAKKYDEMRRAIHTDLAFGLVAGIFLTVAGVLLTPVLLRLMNTPEEVLPQSITYFRIYFYGSLAVVLYNISVGILQAVGDSRHPLYYLIFSALLNVVLDLLFVGGFKMGVGSAAAATVISQAVSALLCLVQLLRTKEVYRISLKKIRFHKDMIGQILRFGLPSGVQNSVIALANVVVQSNINVFGSAAMAGNGSYSRVEGFAFLPITSFSLSLTTFIGQNLGAKKFDRAKSGARFGILCSVVMAEVIGVLIFALAPYLVSLFIDRSDPEQALQVEEIIRIGTRQARTEALFYFLLAYSHCIAGICRGAGKAIVPMIIMLACWCLIRIVYISIIVRFVDDISVIFWAYPLTWGLSSAIFLIYYLKSDWVHAFERRKAAENAAPVGSEEEIVAEEAEEERPE